MRNTNEQSIKEVISELLEAYKLESKLNQVQLINSWEKLLGKNLAKHTKELYIKNQILYVKVDSAALRQELSYAKEKIRDSLNKEVGKNVIEDIIFA